MKESIFRRINRDEYRRETARYFPNGMKRDKDGRVTGRKLRWSTYLIFILPPLYGLFVSLLRDNKARFDAVTGWANPWLHDWVKAHFPSIKRVSANLVDLGHDDLIPLAHHIYSVSALFGVIFFIVMLYYAWSVRATPGRFKRRIIIGSVGMGIGYKKAVIYGVGMLLFMGGLGIYALYVGAIDDGSTTRIRTPILFNHSAWLTSVVTILSTCTAAIIVSLSILWIYYNLKRWYVHIMLGWKNR